MLWLSCLLLLALSGAVSCQGVQPVGRLSTFSVSLRSVSYIFTPSPTYGAGYEVTFIPQRSGIPQPRTERLGRAGFRTKAGLIPDVTYRLQVVAVLGGAKSTPISKDFTTQPDVPSGPPQGLAVTSSTTTSITLSWSDPAPDKINDRDGVRRFVVRRDGQQVANITGRTYTITGLSVATSYTFEVLAVNDQGIAPNNHAARLTATTASGVPNSPTLRVILPRFSSTYLLWTDPEPFVGDILGVQIHYLIDCTPQDIPELGSGIHQYTVPGIKNSAGKTHSISLRARTSAGCGSFSAPVEFTFQPIAEITVTAVGCDKLKVSYTINPLPDGNNGTSLQSLVVRYRPIFGSGSTGSETVPLNGSATEGVLCLSGLTSDTGYRVTYSVELALGFQTMLPSDVPQPVEVFTGSTCNQQQCQDSSRTRTISTSPPATSCTTPPPPACPTPPPTTPTTSPPTTTPTPRMTTTPPTTPPTPPAGVQPIRSLSAFGVSRRSVAYIFTASLTSGASYEVTFMHQRSGIPQTGTDRTPRAGFRNKAGLIPDVTYRLQVVAVLSGVRSTAVSKEFTTQPDVPTGPPLGLAITSSTTTSITLSWRDPAPDKINDRDGVRRFVVRRDGEQVANITGQTYTITGLSVATSYTFEVLAVNDQGIAPNNHAARLTATTASGVPNPPTLRVTLPRFSNTYLLWSDPEPFVGDITGVQIRYLIDGTAKSIPELGGGVRQYTVSGIKDTVGKNHSISLRAKTSAGWGAYSRPIEFTFRPIAEVEVTPGCDTLNVRYTVNSLPGGNNDATLRSMVVKYRAILGSGGSGTRIVPLNGRAAADIVRLSGLARGTAYRVTYSVEVGVNFPVTLPSDIPDAIQVFTSRTCTAVNCGDPGTPRNGRRFGSRTTYNSVVTYICNTGYTRQGPSSRTCQANGQWSGSLLRCNAVNCGDPGTPRNGRRFGFATTFNSRVIYICNPGYTLQGSNRRTCQANGQWSGSLPQCNGFIPQ